MTRQMDPAAQAKGFRTIAAVMLLGAVTIGIALPLLAVMLDIASMVALFGVDVLMLAAVAMGIADLGLAWFFWRRAAAIERALQGLPPRP